MERRTLLFAVLLASSVVATSLFWNIASLVGMASTTYNVQVRRSYFLDPLAIVFLKEDVAVADVLTLEARETWYNLTLSKGEYLVKVYFANSGIYRKEFNIYVAKDIELTVG